MNVFSDNPYDTEFSNCEILGTRGQSAGNGVRVDFNRNVETYDV